MEPRTPQESSAVCLARDGKPVEGPEQRDGCALSSCWLLGGKQPEAGCPCHRNPDAKGRHQQEGERGPNYRPCMRWAAPPHLCLQNSSSPGPHTLEVPRAGRGVDTGLRGPRELCGPETHLPALSLAADDRSMTGARGCQRGFSWGAVKGARTRSRGPCRPWALWRVLGTHPFIKLLRGSVCARAGPPPLRWGASPLTSEESGLQNREGAVLSSVRGGLGSASLAWPIGPLAQRTLWAEGSRRAAVPVAHPAGSQTVPSFCTISHS